MTRSEHIRALLEEYARQRAANDADLDARVAEAERRDPEIARLRADNTHLALDTMRSILSLPTQDARVEAAERMKARGLANNAALRARLKALSLPEDYLARRYRCPVCQDTGYVGEAPSRFCACFETRLRRRQYEDGTMAGTDEQNFDAFDLSRFPEADNQRAEMAAARKVCETFADTFPDTRFRTLLVMGTSGLGKTFLLNCVYARVVDRGLSAVRVTAYRLFEAMRRQHFGEGGEDFSALLEAPLLLIDDLGAEPMLRNVTVEYLSNLFNERLIARRHTMITTNLNIAQLRERYGERVCSRLSDHGAVIRLKGKDLRLP